MHILNILGMWVSAVKDTDGSMRIIDGPYPERNQLFLSDHELRSNLV